MPDKKQQSTVPAAKNQVNDKPDPSGKLAQRQAPPTASVAPVPQPLTASSQHGRSFADALRNLAKNAEEDKVNDRVSPSTIQKVIIYIYTHKKNVEKSRKMDRKNGGNFFKKGGITK